MNLDSLEELSKLKKLWIDKFCSKGWEAPFISFEAWLMLKLIDEKFSELKGISNVKNT